MAAVKLGTVWTARATLYNSAGRKVGTCTDTPNAIAKAFIEHRSATSVACLASQGAYLDRSDYTSRMYQNTCPSGFRRECI